MKFIVESRSAGPVWYVADPKAGRGYPLTGYRNAAQEFENAAMARVAIRRFSSAYEFVVTEVADQS